MTADGTLSVCRWCNAEIEYDSSGEPPWVHVDTGYSDCESDDPDDPMDSHAEPPAMPT